MAQLSATLRQIYIPSKYVVIDYDMLAADMINGTIMFFDNHPPFPADNDADADADADDDESWDFYYDLQSSILPDSLIAVNLELLAALALPVEMMVDAPLNLRDFLVGVEDEAVKISNAAVNNRAFIRCLHAMCNEPELQAYHQRIRALLDLRD